MKRYEVNHNGKITIEENGQWVKYDEAQARIEKLEKALSEAVEQEREKYNNSTTYQFPDWYSQARNALRNDD